MPFRHRGVRYTGGKSKVGKERERRGELTEEFERLVGMEEIAWRLKSRVT